MWQQMENLKSEISRSLTMNRAQRRQQERQQKKAQQQKNNMTESLERLQTLAGIKKRKL